MPYEVSPTVWEESACVENEELHPGELRETKVAVTG